MGVDFCKTALKTLCGIRVDQRGVNRREVVGHRHQEPVCARGLHIEKLIIYELSSTNFTTQNNLY